ncbi:MAG: class I SAM-dependent methyltransferase [Azospirillaceae bacterium]
MRYRHVLVDGLTRHSARVFPTLDVREGDRVVDVGCGFGDTAMALARRVGPTGSALAIDCCDAFLALGPAGEVHREAGPLAEDKHDAIVADMGTLLADYVTDECVVMPSSSWKIDARRPE